MSDEIELDDLTFETVSAEAIATGRTVEQQITHWIVLGRAIERNPNFHFPVVQSALLGTLAIEHLSEIERAVLNEYVLAVLVRIDPTAGAFLDFRLTKGDVAGAKADDSTQKPGD